MGRRRIPSRAPLAGLLAGLVLVGACGGGPGRDPVSTPSPATATASPTATPTATPDLIGPPPLTVAEAGARLAALLAAGPLCIEPVKLRWNAECMAGDFDGDGRADAAYVVPLPAAGTRQPAAAFILRAAAPMQTLAPDGAADTSQLARDLFRATDRSGDGRPDITVLLTSCAADCATRVLVQSWDGTSWREIGPGQAFDNLDRVTFTGTASTRTLSVRSQPLENRAVGPTREVTFSFALKDGVYQFESATPATPTYLYHAIQDADARFLLGDYTGAITAYEAAIADPRLKDWQAEAGRGDGRARLSGYALFRISVATAASGQPEAVVLASFDRVIRDGGALFTQVTTAFRGGYLDQGARPRAGCQEAVAYLRQPSVRPFLDELFDYGPANLPRPAPEDVCPL